MAYIVAVPAHMIEKVSPHLPEPLRKEFEENVQRIPASLVWTERDLRVLLEEALNECPKERASSFNMDSAMEDLLLNLELDYAIETVNMVLQEAAEDYLREKLGETDD